MVHRCQGSGGGADERGGRDERVTVRPCRSRGRHPGTGTMLCFMGHALMENRSGLIVQGDLTQADGHAERRAALLWCIAILPDRAGG